VVGRYVLPGKIFDAIADTKPGSGGEIQLTDAMARMIGEQAFHAVTFAGRRFDCGSKTGFVEATLTLALERGDIGPEVRQIAERLLAGG
jgi:UTP--glucose-1-phosphate uridylyltransferase